MYTIFIHSMINTFTYQHCKWHSQVFVLWGPCFPHPVIWYYIPDMVTPISFLTMNESVLPLVSIRCRHWCDITWEKETWQAGNFKNRQNNQTTNAQWNIPRMRKVGPFSAAYLNYCLTIGYCRKHRNWTPDRVVRTHVLYSESRGFVHRSGGSPSWPRVLEHFLRPYKLD